MEGSGEYLMMFVFFVFLCFSLFFFVFLWFFLGFLGFFFIAGTRHRTPFGRPLRIDLISRFRFFSIDVSV